MDLLTTNNITPYEWNKIPPHIREYIRMLEQRIVDDAMKNIGKDLTYAKDKQTKGQTY